MQKFEKKDEHVPTCLAYDNIDRNKETLSGEGTSHRVDSIVIQPEVHTSSMAVKDNPARIKTKNRSIQTTVVELPVCNAEVRVGPQALSLSEEV